MSYVQNNSYSNFSYNQMGASLMMLQQHLPGMAPTIGVPPSLVTWGETCYTNWSDKRVLSGEESGERNVAFEGYRMQYDATHDRYVLVRGVIDSLVRDEDKGDEILKQYGFIGTSPINRDELTNKIKLVKKTSDGLRTAGSPYVIDDGIITRLVDDMNTMNTLWITAQAEANDASKAYDDLHALYAENGQKMRHIYQYAILSLGKYNPDLLLLGFAPETPPKGHGQPGTVQNFSLVPALPEVQFTWDISPTATSYQLVYSPDGEDYEELYAGQDANYTYLQQAGTFYYKVRARNAHGFSEFSAVLEYTV